LRFAARLSRPASVSASRLPAEINPVETGIDLAPAEAHQIDALAEGCAVRRLDHPRVPGQIPQDRDPVGRSRRVGAGKARRPAQGIHRGFGARAGQDHRLLRRSPLKDVRGQRIGRGAGGEAGRAEIHPSRDR
jgi:hypothetical protein